MLQRFLIALLISICIPHAYSQENPAGKSLPQLAKLGKHENEEVRVRLHKHKGNIIAYIGAKTNPPEIGFVDTSELDIKNPTILVTQKLADLLEKEETAVFIADLTISYESQPTDTYQVNTAEIYDTKDLEKANWEKMQPWKSSGLQEDIAVTVRVRKHEGRIGASFINLRKGEAWPRQGYTFIKNPEILKVPEFEGDTAFFDYVLTVNITEPPDKPGPRFYSAEVLKCEFIRPTLKDPREEPESSLSLNKIIYQTKNKVNQVLREGTRHLLDTNSSN
jgi:hypothetical protein